MFAIQRFIASFAPLVFYAVKQGDYVAEKLLNKTVIHWAKLIECASTYVPHTKKLAIVGGLFKEKEILLPLLEEKLTLEKEFVLPSLPPVFGALREAFKLADVKVDKIIENNLIKTKLDRLAVVVNKDFEKCLEHFLVLLHRFALLQILFAASKIIASIIETRLTIASL